MWRCKMFMGQQINYDDINKFGVNLQFVEFKIGVVEQRINERLTEYFREKLAKTHTGLDNVHIRDMVYRKVGSNQELLCCVKFEGYSLFFNITYTPFEHNKTGAVGLKFNKCIPLHLFDDRKQIKERYENLNKFKRCDCE